MRRGLIVLEFFSDGECNFDNEPGNSLEQYEDDGHFCPVTTPVTPCIMFMYFIVGRMESSILE